MVIIFFSFGITILLLLYFKRCLFEELKNNLILLNYFYISLVIILYILESVQGLCYIVNIQNFLIKILNLYKLSFGFNPIFICEKESPKRIKSEPKSKTLDGLISKMHRLRIVVAKKQESLSIPRGYANSN